METIDRSIWTPQQKREAFSLVLTKLIKGESLRMATRKSERHRIPSRWTLIQWMKKSEAMHFEYLFACEQRADKIFEEIIFIADNVKLDKMEIRKALLQIDTRKWALGKMYKSKIMAKN